MCCVFFLINLIVIEGHLRPLFCKNNLDVQFLWQNKRSIRSKNVLIWKWNKKTMFFNVCCFLEPLRMCVVYLFACLFFLFGTHVFWIILAQTKCFENGILLSMIVIKYKPFLRSTINVRDWTLQLHSNHSEIDAKLTKIMFVE